MTDLELGWLAGFYEGEGNVYCGRGRHSSTGRQLSISIQQKEVELLLRVRSLVGFGSIRPKKNNGIPDSIYVWAASGAEAIRLINLLMPYMSEKRQEQLKKAKVSYETRSRLGDRQLGSRTSPGQLKLIS